MSVPESAIKAVVNELEGHARRAAKAGDHEAYRAFKIAQAEVDALLVQSKARDAERGDPE